MASYGAKRFAGPEKRYGASGNRFVAMVEFGETPRAKSLLAGDKAATQGPRTALTRRGYTLEGRFKDVAYYREVYWPGAQSIYQPGAESCQDPEAGHANNKAFSQTEGLVVSWMSYSS